MLARAGEDFTAPGLIKNTGNNVLVKFHNCIWTPALVPI